MLSPVERVLLLKKIDLLERASPRALAALADVARELEIEPGQVLYAEADLADAVYVVAAGRVKLARGEQTVSEAAPGDAFGTWGLVDDSTRGHRAECVEPGQLLALGREEFDEFTLNAPAVLRGVTRVLAARLRAVADKLGDSDRIEAEGTGGDAAPESKPTS